MRAESVAESWCRKWKKQLQQGLHVYRTNAWGKMSLYRFFISLTNLLYGGEFDSFTVSLHLQHTPVGGVLVLSLSLNILAVSWTVAVLSLIQVIFSPIQGCNMCAQQRERTEQIRQQIVAALKPIHMHIHMQLNHPFTACGKMLLVKTGRAK